MRCYPSPSPFKWLWTCQLLLLFVGSGSGIVLTLTLFEETGSVAALAAVTALGAAGAIYLAPLIGSALDRYPRRTSMIVINLVNAVAAGLMAAVVTVEVLWLPAVLSLVLLSSICSTALGLTLQASVRELRSESDLTRINGVTSLIESVPVLLGPLFGVLLYTAFSPVAVFATEAVMSVVVACGIVRLRWGTGGPGPESTVESSGLVQGMRFIFGSRDLRILQISFSGFNLFNGLGTPVATAYVVYHGIGDAGWGLASVSVAGAAGLLVGSTAVVAFGASSRRSLMVGGGQILATLTGRVALIATTAVGVWVACYFLRGVSLQVSNSPLTAIWQERTPARLQATVFGCRRLVGQGLYPVAVVFGGVLVEWCVDAGVSMDRALVAVLALGAAGELACSVVLMASRAVGRLSPRDS